MEPPRRGDRPHLNRRHVACWFADCVPASMQTRGGCRTAALGLEVFVRGDDNALWHIWQMAPNNGWSGWASLGGNFPADPAIFHNADGRDSDGTRRRGLSVGRGRGRRQDGPGSGEQRASHKHRRDNRPDFPIRLHRCQRDSMASGVNRHPQFCDARPSSPRRRLSTDGAFPLNR